MSFGDRSYPFKGKSTLKQMLEKKLTTLYAKNTKKKKKKKIVKLPVWMFFFFQNLFTLYGKKMF